MKLLSRVLLRLGYVRLVDFGYTLTPEGRIVELPRVTDDRFAPPPWEPIAWQSSAPMLADSPPVPRPLPPPPRPGESLFSTGSLIAPETRAPSAVAVAGTIVGSASPAGPDGQLHPPSAHAAPVQVEDEEWEWRVALARARERAARDAARSGVRARSATDRNTNATGTQIGAGPGRAPAPRQSLFGAARADGTGRSVWATSGQQRTDPTGTQLFGSRVADDGRDFAEGSKRHPVTRGESIDATATDVTVAPARDEDQTKVDATAARLARALHGEPAEHGEQEPLDDSGAGEMATSVMSLPPPPAPTGESPLPRATTRLRRPTAH